MTKQLFPLFSSSKDSLLIDLNYSLALVFVYLVNSFWSQGRNPWLILTFFLAHSWHPGTEKVRQAQGCKHLQVVNPDWLWSCLERWERVEEQLYPLKEDYSKTPRWKSICLKAHPKLCRCELFTEKHCIGIVGINCNRSKPDNSKSDVFVSHVTGATVLQHSLTT